MTNFGKKSQKLPIFGSKTPIFGQKSTFFIVFVVFSLYLSRSLKRSMKQSNQVRKHEFNVKKSRKSRIVFLTEMAACPHLLTLCFSQIFEFQTRNLQFWTSGDFLGAFSKISAKWRFQAWKFQGAISKISDFQI